MDVNNSNIFDVLTQKYPLAFKGFDQSNYYSFIPSGWVSLIDRFCKEITPVLEESYSKYPLEDGQSGFQFAQIKEKFGTLRIYFDCMSNDPKLYDIITEAVQRYEWESSRICEQTGEVGTICVRNIWLKTLSPTLQKEHGYKPYDPEKDSII